METEQASAAERRLRVLGEGARDVVVETDLEGIVRYVSPSIRDVLGYEPEEVVGRSGSSFVHPEDRASFRPAPDANVPDLYRYRAVRKDGAIRWMESITRPLLDARGEPSGRVSAVRDVTRRIEAEERLRASEARWRSLVETAADYVYTVDPDLRITFLNRDAPGRPREVIVGQPVISWSPVEDHERTRAAYARVFGQGEVVTYTTRASTATGEEHVYETRISPVWRDERVVSATVVSREVTERVRLEEALRVSEDRFRRLAESGMLGIAVGDFSGRVIEANDAFLAAIGHPREAVEAGTLRWSDITPPESAARDREAIAELLARGATTPYEKEYVRADGTRAHVLVGSAILDAQKGLSVAFAVDVSARHAAEAAARNEKRLADTILDAQAELGEAIALVDDRGRLVHINDALVTLTGYPRDELLALPNPVAAVTAPEAADVWATRFAALARGEEVPPRFDSWIRRRDGTSLPVEIVGTNVLYQERRCRLYILRDLTMQRAAQRELETARSALAQAEKLAALGTLVSGVAHEARTPMTAMMNASHLLQARAAAGKMDPAITPLLETVVESATRLNEFLEDLRRFTRKGVDARVPLSLDAPVGDALRLLAQTHPAARRVDARLRPTPPTLANPARVAQVVINLVQNAFDASPHGTPVRVFTGEAPEGGALLVVEDEGIGMDEEVQRRMFDALYTTKPDGTGLGLAIVRRILDEHRARIEVESAPGKGTRVRVVFPPAQ